MWLYDLVDGLVDKVFGAKCPACGNRSLQHSYKWIRGWNNLCKQAVGDSGYRCYDCGYIVWDVPYETFRESLPKWCVAYTDSQLKVKLTKKHKKPKKD